VTGAAVHSGAGFFTSRRCWPVANKR
jgi:hypothetical protein